MSEFVMVATIPEIVVVVCISIGLGFCVGRVVSNVQYRLTQDAEAYTITAEQEAAIDDHYERLARENETTTETSGLRLGSCVSSGTAYHLLD